MKKKVSNKRIILKVELAIYEPMEDWIYDIADQIKKDGVEFIFNELSPVLSHSVLSYSVKEASSEIDSERFVDPYDINCMYDISCLED